MNSYLVITIEETHTVTGFPNHSVSSFQMTVNDEDNTALLTVFMKEGGLHKFMLSRTDLEVFMKANFGL